MNPTSILPIQLDFRSGVSIYAQLVEQIRGMVARGELKPGDQLPTVRQLAMELRVNFNTVARAYRLLDEAGLISTQQGRGTYIWEPPGPKAQEHLREDLLESLARQYLQEALRLGFSSAEILQALQKQIETE
ncbi:MAG TPA: GntR family transcriptional regulator, partial [Anaerolineaceae bacterium]|nr:GntR family transcriptional regulator [Anaerolineaceae bacterium]